MPERNGYLPGVPCWVDTGQPDPAAAVDFYSGLFGWELEDVMPPGSPGPYYIARLRGGDVAAIASQSGDGSSAAVWNTYIWVFSADESAAKVRAAGGSIVTEPFDVPNAGRMAVFADPEGAEFRVWQAGQHKGAQIVNEQGALNFNTLNTRDAERAKAFYGAVFGWETLQLGPGGAMWTLPGYGDHLEESDPQLRRRMAEVEAPEGFEDVVAALNAIPADEGEAPARWEVTFGVEDADATAARAVELGGKLIAPPFDAPWVRMAIVADPQGATFTASQFVPENRHLESQGATTAEAA